MSDAVRAEKIAHEVDYAAHQLAQAGRLDLTHEFIQHGDVTVYAHVTSVARRACPLPSAWAVLAFRSTVPRCCAEPCYTITFSTIGMTPIRAIDCTDFGIHFLPWHVPKRILS